MKNQKEIKKNSKDITSIIKIATFIKSGGGTGPVKPGNL